MKDWQNLNLHSKNLCIEMGFDDNTAQKLKQII